MDYIIIVAGGKGLRMGGDIPKQFLPIGGKPVLMRTIDRFREYDKGIGIVLVLPKAQQDYWKELCEIMEHTNCRWWSDKIPFRAEWPQPHS